jgi:hypothetical protein
LEICCETEHEVINKSGTKIFKKQKLAFLQLDIFLMGLLTIDSLLLIKKG